MTLETLPQLLRRHAVSNTDAVALTVADGPPLTYGAWDAAARAVAAGLVARGVRPGDRVLLVFDEREWDRYAVAFLGVLAAGAVGVPCAASTPDEELSQRARDADVAGVVVEHAQPPAAPVRWALSDLERTAFDAGAAHLPSIAGSDPAQIVYTSGTTGRPRGVLARHGNLVTLPGRAFAAKDARTVERRTTFIHAMPIGTTASQTVLFRPLTRNVSVVALPQFDPEAFGAFTHQHAIEETVLVPTTAAALVRQRPWERHDMSSLVLIGLTGASSPPRLLRDLSEAFPRASLVNFYTSTEAAPAFSYVDYDPARHTAIGRVDSSRLLVLGDDGKPVPQRTTGAIALRAVHPPREYWREVEAVESTDGWIRTGDLGVIDDDGFVHLVGRASEMITSGGFEVSPLEVEHALAEHDAVRDAAVIGVPHPTLGERTVAFVVASSETDATALTYFLRARLAPHKVPHDIHLVPELPRTRHGKLRRDDVAALLEDCGGDDLQTPAERFVADIWADVLGVDVVTADQSLFALGGDSLAAMQVAARISAELDVELPLERLLLAPTLREMSATLEAALRTTEAATTNE